MDKQPYVGSVLVMRPGSAILHYTIAVLASSQAEAGKEALEAARARWQPVVAAGTEPIFVELILDTLEEVLDGARDTETAGSPS